MQTTQLMPPMRESAPQTAVRLRRSLRERWPTTRFSVRTTRGAELVVSWTGGPRTNQVAEAAAGFARTIAGDRQEPTLWIGPRGGVALIWPGAELVLPERRQGEDAVERRAA